MTKKWPEYLNMPMKVETLKTWDDFRAFVLDMTTSDFSPVCNPKLLWRGQRDVNWKLASSFERVMLRFPANTFPEGVRARERYEDMRGRYLQEFVRTSSGLRGRAPAKLEADELWALARHHGLVTPLLDWTRSPYIAAHFALRELLTEIHSARGSNRPYESRPVAIFLFNPWFETFADLRIVEPVVEELNRLHGQRGVFTWLDTPDFFDLQSYLEANGRGRCLTKAVLSDQAVAEGLHELRLYGIDERLLFPDLDGAARAANDNVHFDYISMMRPARLEAEQQALLNRLQEPVNAEMDESGDVAPTAPSPEPFRDKT